MLRATKPQRNQRKAAPHNKPPRAAPTTRKIPAIKSKIRFSDEGVPFKGSGKTETVEAPSGAILSSPHANKSQQMRTMVKKFTHKFHRTRGSLGRDLSSHRYTRMTFPNQVVTMLYPGNNLPSDVNIFKVPLNMNRIQIKNYMEELYGVSVIKVNTAICIGKRAIDQYGRFIKKPDWKKAYVRTTTTFNFPWPRPTTYPLTAKQKEKEAAKKKKEKEDREREKQEMMANAV